MSIPVEIQSLIDRFCAIDGVKSAKIGVEKGLSPLDYPMVRVVPVRFTPGKPYGHRTCELSIYFGVNIAESNGMDDVYSCSLQLEREIIEQISLAGGRYIETLTDEDRLETYKLMFIRCELQVEG